MRRPLVVLLALLPLAACSGDDGGGEAATTTVDPAEQLLTVNATVLEDDGQLFEAHGPVACGIILESNPPQCDGTPLVDFDWADVEGEERLLGTTWGEVNLVGTYDGTTFTVERTDGPDLPRPDDPEAPTLCDEPEGGRALVQTRGVHVPGEVRSSVLGSWLSEGATVQNYRVVVGAVDEVTAAVREAGYEGSLCVVESDGPTPAELRQVQTDLRRLPDDNPLGALRGSFPDEPTQSVHLEVVFLTDEGRAYAADRWGDLIQLTSWMVPLADVDD